MIFRFTDMVKQSNKAFGLRHFVYIALFNCMRSLQMGCSTAAHPLTIHKPDRARIFLTDMGVFFMKNIAIMGAGNVGTYAARAVLAAEDMQLCGFIRRQEDEVEGFINVPVVSAAERLSVLPDGVIICVPSRRSAAAAKYLLGMGINTVDACDLHEELPRIRRELHEAAVHGGAVAITGAGWDPGLDSAVRMLMAAALPCGATHTLSSDRGRAWGTALPQKPLTAFLTRWR